MVTLSESELEQLRDDLEATRKAMRERRLNTQGQDNALKETLYRLWRIKKDSKPACDYCPRPTQRMGVA